MHGGCKEHDVGWKVFHSQLLSATCIWPNLAPGAGKVHDCFIFNLALINGRKLSEF